MDIGDIVEVQQLRFRELNLYLEHGYRLLSIQAYTRSALYGDTKQYYVHRGTEYIVGRAAVTPQWTPPGRIPRPAVAATVVVEI